MVTIRDIGCPFSHTLDASELCFWHCDGALPGLFHEGARRMFRTSAPDTHLVASPLHHDARPDGSSPSLDRHASRQVAHAAHPRQVSGQRQSGDSTTFEAEREFLQAIEEYKEKSGRMFPTWSEVLEVLQTLGYQKPR
jgi:hypothetical protein